MNSYTLPAGRYYVGDPCYVFGDGWDKVLSNCDFFRKYPQGEFAEKIWGHTTAWGDGGYYGTDGKLYAVDAGLLGVVHESIMEHEPDDGGKIVEFKEPFNCWYEEENGVICIGDLRIETDADEPDTCFTCGEYEDDCVCEEW